MNNKNKTISKKLSLSFGTIIAIVSLFVGNGCNSSNNDYALAIERVYNQLEMYDNMLEKDFNRENIEIYTISVKQIDVSSCPDDFTKVYKEYVVFCEDFNQFMKDAPVSTFEKWSFAFVHLFDGKTDELLNNADSYLKRGSEITAKMNSIASKYGIVFDKEGKIIHTEKR